MGDNLKLQEDSLQIEPTTEIPYLPDPEVIGKAPDAGLSICRTEDNVRIRNGAEVYDVSLTALRSKQLYLKRISGDVPLDPLYRAPPPSNQKRNRRYDVGDVDRDSDGYWLNCNPSDIRKSERLSLKGWRKYSPTSGSEF